MGAIHQRQEQCKILRGLRIIGSVCTDCGCICHTSPAMQHLTFYSRSNCECSLPGHSNIGLSRIGTATGQISEYSSFGCPFPLVAGVLRGARNVIGLIVPHAMLQVGKEGVKISMVACRAMVTRARCIGTAVCCIGGRHFAADPPALGRQRMCFSRIARFVSQACTRQLAARGVIA